MSRLKFGGSVYGCIYLFYKCINISCRYASVEMSGIIFPSVLETVYDPLVFLSSKSAFFNDVSKSILENCMINTQGSCVEIIHQESTFSRARKVGN